MVVGKILCVIFLMSPWFYKDEVVELRYIHAYQDLAIEAMHEYGIPASIKLAQALVESDAGRSVLATRANNHFGIKCKPWWTGGQYFYADDDLDPTRRLTASCFRIYDSVHQSFQDHSLFLKSSNRYDPLFSYALSDYHSWAIGLQECGYATSPHYCKNLILVIEKYRLFELDQLIPDRSSAQK